MAKDFSTLFGCAPGAEGDVVCVGAPYSRGSPPEHGGCALAPHCLRRLSGPETIRLRKGELFDLRNGRTLVHGSSLSDLGDLKYRPSQSDGSYLDFLSHTIRLIVAEGKRPIVLGGDHVVTLAVLRGIAGAGREVQVVQLDAHHDYEEVVAGELPTHATFVSYIASEGLAKKVVQLGVRGLSWGRPAAPEGVVHVSPSELAEALIPGLDVYLTVDTDAFDPAVAPAVHYPEPDGLTLHSLGQVLDVFRTLRIRGAGCDWTEYSPDLDPPNFITGRFVLHGLAQMIEFLAEDRQA